MPLGYSSTVDGTLLNTQKRQVFDLLQAFEINPHQFEWKVKTSRFGATAISLITSKQRAEFYFAFDFADGFYYPYCSPWEGQRECSFQDLPWSDCLRKIETWGLVVQAELNTPDPWKALPGIVATSDIALAADALNTEFAHRETERLAAALDEIKNLLLNHIGTSGEQAALVQNEIKTLLDASERMGRKDWTNLAIGAIVSLGLQLALPPETVKQAFQILKEALTGLVPLVPHVFATGQHLT
jgi:hypothetical protein